MQMTWLFLALRSWSWIVGHVRNPERCWFCGKWSHRWSTTLNNRELTLCWHRLKGSRGIGPEEAMSADTDLVPRQQVSCSEARSRHRKFARWKRWRHWMATACSLATLACFCQIANSPKAYAGRTQDTFQKDMYSSVGPQLDLPWFWIKLSFLQIFSVFGLSMLNFGSTTALTQILRPVGCWKAQDQNSDSTMTRIH